MKWPSQDAAALIEAARAEVVFDQERVARNRAPLYRRLAAGVVAAAVTSSSVAAGVAAPAAGGSVWLAKGLLVKGLLGATLVAAGGTGYLALTRGAAPSPDRRLSHSAATAPRAPTVATPTVVAPPGVDTPLVEPRVPPPPPSSRRRVAPRPAPAARPVAGVADPRDTELQAQVTRLSDARAALASGDARAALALLTAWPGGKSGPLQEERAAAFALVLCQLGDGRASAVAGAFLRDHPASAHAPQVREACLIPAPVRR